MRELKAAVQEFRHKSRLPRFNQLGAITPKERLQLSASLCLEETIEAVAGMGVSPQLVALLKDCAKAAVESIDPTKVDLTEVADGLGDSDFVNEWVRCELGIHGEPVMVAINEANLAKFGPGSHFREDGKVLKPEGWKPPDIDAVLRNQPVVSYVVLRNEDGTQYELTTAIGYEHNPKPRRDTDGNPMEVVFHFSAPTYETARLTYEYLLNEELL
jgi:predicted HAD superfamily Cof-like phosphohydrolase